jgi:transcription elongation factor Elf1
MEVRCPECGTMNNVPIHSQGGTITVFCKSCGEEIHLTLSRTLLDMELKRLPINQQGND